MKFQLNTHDKKAISSLMIAQASMVNVIILLKKAYSIEGKSEYYKNKIKSILDSCIKFENWLNMSNDRFAETMNRNDKVTMINRASEHITKSDELMGDKLIVATAELGDVYIKKTVSAITIIQSSLINADRIFSSSLEHSKKKDMITKDVIEDILDKIDDYVEWISEIVDFLSASMTKEEMSVLDERAGIYINLVDKENGLL